jgi:hypothetical protein
MNVKPGYEEIGAKFFERTDGAVTADSAMKLIQLRGSTHQKRR